MSGACGELLPPACECDNTHKAQDTVCRWCWARGRRKWSDPDVCECLGKGWDYFNEGDAYEGLSEIQRCDSCMKYETDEDAAKASGVSFEMRDLRGYPAPFAPTPKGTDMSDKKTMPYANLISFVFYSESPVDDVRKLQEFAAEDPNSLDSLETVARIASFAAYKAVKNDEVPQEIIGSCDGGSVSISTIVRPHTWMQSDS
jgi:hypothetical protein